MPLMVKDSKLLLVGGEIAAHEDCCCGCPCPSRTGTINVTFSVTSSPAWCDFNGDYTTDDLGGNLTFDFDAGGGPGLSPLLLEVIDTSAGGTGTGVLMAPQVDCCADEGVYHFNVVSSANQWANYVAGVRVCRIDLPFGSGCGGSFNVIDAVVTVVSCDPLHITITINNVTDPDDPMNTGTLEIEITE